MDQISRYLEVFEGLNRAKKWSTDSNVLRFAALTLAASNVEDPGVRIEQTAKILAREGGVFSPLNTSLRHAVAAILMRRGLEPVATIRWTNETLAVFKEHGLATRESNPFLAALLLVLDSGGGLPSNDTITRMKAIIDRWKKDHRWLTGVNDYPMAAMHATRETAVEELGIEVEQIYTSLRKAKFAMGNQLQLVSHLLVLSDLGPQGAAHRFVQMAAALRGNGQRVWESHYDEVALLVLSGGDADEIATRAVEYRERLRAVKPRPEASIAFSIASGIVLAEEAKRLGGFSDATSAATLRSVQGLLEAQQAAMVACVAACSATVVISASS